MTFDQRRPRDRADRPRRPRPRHRGGLHLHARTLRRPLRTARSGDQRAAVRRRLRPRGTVRAGGRQYPPAYVSYERVKQDPALHFRAGGPGRSRELNILIGKNVEAGRLLAGVTFSDPGNWTSWPPHEHAEMLEEVYLYIDMPAPAFGVQYVYTIARIRRSPPSCAKATPCHPAGLSPQRRRARRPNRLSLVHGGPSRSGRTASSASSTSSPSSRRRAPASRPRRPERDRNAPATLNHFDLTGKVALVTGASGGLGAAYGARARRSRRRHGAYTATAGRATRPARRWSRRGRRAASVTANLSDRAASDRAIAETIAAFGRLDILVNNAGTMRRAPAADHGDEDWDLVVEVNLTSVFRLARAAGVTSSRRAAARSSTSRRCCRSRAASPCRAMRRPRAASRS